MRRYLTLGVALVGVALIALPLAMSMFGRSNDGRAMVDDFRPIMQPASVQKTSDYYDLFVTWGNDFSQIMTQENVATFQGYMQGIGAMQAEFPKLIHALGRQLGMTDAQVNAFLADEFPAVAGGLQAMPQMGRDFAGMIAVMEKDVGPFQQVKPALDHYGDLVARMERNVDTYASVDAMPRMSLLPWFFVIPGALLLALAGSLLYLDARAPRPAVASHPALG